MRVELGFDEIGNRGFRVLEYDLETGMATVELEAPPRHMRMRIKATGEVRCECEFPEDDAGLMAFLGINKLEDSIDMVDGAGEEAVAEYNVRVAGYDARCVALRDATPEALKAALPSRITDRRSAAERKVNTKVSLFYGETPHIVRDPE